MYVIQPSFMLRLFYDKYRYYKSTFYDKYRYYKSTAAIKFQYLEQFQLIWLQSQKTLRWKTKRLLNISVIYEIFTEEIKHGFFFNKLISKIKLKANLHLNNTKIAEL